MEPGVRRRASRKPWPGCGGAVPAVARLCQLSRVPGAAVQGCVNRAVMAHSTALCAWASSI